MASKRTIEQWCSSQPNNESIVLENKVNILEY